MVAMPLATRLFASPKISCPPTRDGNLNANGNASSVAVLYHIYRMSGETAARSCQPRVNGKVMAVST